jgi:hypothetical protein
MLEYDFLFRLQLAEAVEEENGDFPVKSGAGAFLFWPV